jgi:hypothetical protein
MASLRMTLLDLLNKSVQGADPNFLRDGVQLLAQRPLMHHLRSSPLEPNRRMSQRARAGF